VTEQQITWGLRIFFALIALLLILQGEWIIATLPILLIGGIEWRKSTSNKAEMQSDI